jgi:hypothetical protein
VAVDHISADGILRGGIDSAATVAPNETEFKKSIDITDGKEMHRGPNYQRTFVQPVPGFREPESAAGSDY